MRHAFLALAALALCACQPQAPDGERAPPPADAPDVTEAPETSERPDEGDAEPQFAGDIDARGTEPFWAVQIRGDRITLTRPEPEPPVSAANPGATETGSEAVWSTTAAGKPFIVTLVDEGTCSDGMSDFDYPYVAVVTLGELTFRGCAVKTSALPPEKGR